MPQTNPKLQTVANSLKTVIQDLLSAGGVTFTHDTQIVEKDIIEYESRLRVFGLAKFNKPCFITAVNFYASQRDMESHNPLGALVVYIEADNSDKVSKALGVGLKIDDEDEAVLEKIGELGRVIAEPYLRILQSNGYSQLVFSKPQSYFNDVPEGVEFNYNEYKYYEISFFAWKEKILVADITLAPA